MRLKKSLLFPSLIAIGSFGSALPALGCDLCATYSSERVGDPVAGDVFVGASEQFTSFRRLQDGGQRISDPVHQYMESSITNIFGRYAFSESLALQGNVPFIRRSFRRPAGELINEGSVTGIGDMSLLGLFTPVRIQNPDYSFHLTLRGGIKMPTGDPDRIDEELSEDHDDEHSQSVPSGVHGHDLALGSGSWDVPLGANFWGTYGNWLYSGGLQYQLRNSGEIHYRYANDLLWDASVGRYLMLDDRGTIALRANLLGEAKGKDRLSGEEQEDTGITSMYAGPEIAFSVRDKVFGLLALDLPVAVNNTSIQLTADYRIRMALTYRF